MKKSLLALAVLGAFAGAASAQSNVTLYGRVDLSFAQNLGSDAQAIQNGSGSRLGLRGTEDLGGGLAAVFNIEHRFDADTGETQGYVNAGGSAAPTNVRFWSARSIVGLKSNNFGQVVLGREYTTAFLGSQLLNDPWGWDTVASQITVPLTGGAVSKLRNDSSITYNLSMAGFNFGAQYAEATDKINSFADNPWNVSAGWAGGPFSVNFGYEFTGNKTSLNKSEEVYSLGGAWNAGVAKIGGSYVVGRLGNKTSDAKTESWSLWATAVLGQGEIRALWGTQDKADVTVINGFALGYHYALSKRTTIYADFVNNSKLANNESGYDFGIKHNF